ncbi:hypothetical protein F383_37024 [Gossypium arboreum]|uniref:Uncharacterized protein n=1 Tax=Gossypium arboreum TaxID=29729 RepID=A0A0B0M6V4_GOSAR|nr:hypothetical protein F383_37024 [Gossypium arboreum]
MDQSTFLEQFPASLTVCPLFLLV